MKNALPVSSNSLTGRQQFMEVEFLVGSDALAPRKETELLGYAALEIVDQIMSEQITTRIIDVCTGLGILALAIAKKRPGLQVFAAGLSADAINLAKRNAINLDLENRVTFYVSDLLNHFESMEYYNSNDLLICKPLYLY